MEQGIVYPQVVGSSPSVTAGGSESLGYFGKDVLALRRCIEQVRILTFGGNSTTQLDFLRFFERVT